LSIETKETVDKTLSTLYVRAACESESPKSTVLSKGLLAAAAAATTTTTNTTAFYNIILLFLLVH
jgi:hypothetical protein